MACRLSRHLLVMETFRVFNLDKRCEANGVLGTGEQSAEALKRENQACGSCEEFHTGLEHQLFSRIK